jgi:hypothetical protein
VKDHRIWEIVTSDLAPLKAAAEAIRHDLAAHGSAYVGPARRPESSPCGEPSLGTVGISRFSGSFGFLRGSGPFRAQTPRAHREHKGGRTDLTATDPQDRVRSVAHRSGSLRFPRAPRSALGANAIWEL